MYKFLGKKGAYYQLDLEPISIKLNYKCKEGTVEEGSFSCGKTPEEAKKNYEKQQKEKLPSSKSKLVPQNTAKITKKDYDNLNSKLEIAKSIYSKAFKEENKYLNEHNYDTTSNEYKKLKNIKDLALKEFNVLDKQKNIYNKIIEENKKLDQKNYSGLAKIQSRIQKVGSIEKFLKTAKIPDLDQDVRPEVDVFETNSLAIKKAFDEYTEFFGEPKTIKTIGNIEIKVTGNKEPHILIMSKNGTLLGFVNGYNDGVNAILADELRGSGGIGKIALIEFFNRNPNKLTDVGGLTPNGKKAYVKMLESINTGYKEHTFTKDEINEINKKVNFADKKSKLDPMSKEDIPIDRNKSITIKYPGSSLFVVKPGTVWQDTFDEKKVYIKGINDKYVFLRHEDGSNEMQDIKTFRNRTIKALERVR